MPNSDVAGPNDDIIYPSALPFVLVHLSCVAAIWSGVTWQAIAICVALYWVRIFAIGAGYHRYFSHRAYSTSRVFSIRPRLPRPEQRPKERSVVGCQAPASPLAFRYRAGRAFTSAQGFHLQPCGMDFCPEARRNRLGEDCGFRALSRVDVAAQIRTPACHCSWRSLLSRCRVVWPGGRILLEHGARLSRNLLPSIRSRMCAAASDTSPATILATTGSWRFLRWARAGTTITTLVKAAFGRASDGGRSTPTYYILRALSWLRIVWDLKTPPAQVLRNEQRLGVAGHQSCGRAARGTFQFRTDCACHHIGAARSAVVPRCRTRLSVPITARPRCWRALHLPHMPTREEFLAEAKAMFARTKSLDEIVDRAYELLLESLVTRLAVRVEARA